MNLLCVHGHFYQPPRENPWTGEIELQESAAPFHDWNERITAECYAPNANPGERSPGDPWPSNYARISFDFGPTLLSWMERRAPHVYRAILEADRASRERFSGHGGAMAQAYNHIILPLATRRDKETQVRWGMRDFEYRFGRRPEGMWLPETAVDLETLDVLAAESIRYTILAPDQAARWREAREDRWCDASSEAVHSPGAYEVRLSSSRRLAIFFYDGPASHAIAFGGLREGGESLARRLSDIPTDGSSSGLACVATDGETYGHHYRGGERVLAEALERITRADSSRLTNFAEFLSSHAPAREVQVREDTSWSCIHGLGRWKEDCGCKTGEHPEWNQAWRAPLREALDALRDSLAEFYEREASRLLADPWKARDDSIALWLDRSPENLRRFFQLHGRADLSESEQARALDFLDLQRYAMFMYTSCGWFFDDVGGLEGRQILQYAGRAIEIAGRLGARGLEACFLDRLEAARSNAPERENARRVYELCVLPFVRSG